MAESPDCGVDHFAEASADKVGLGLRCGVWIACKGMFDAARHDCMRTAILLMSASSGRGIE